MRNKAMERKQKAGALVDVSPYPRVGPFYLVPWEAEFAQHNNVDFADCQTEQWIWSIGRALKDLSWDYEGTTHLVRKGQVLAATTTVFYESADDFECVWLR